MELGWPRKKKKIPFELKQTQTRSVSVLFRFVLWNHKQNISVCWVFRTYIETIETNRTVSKKPINPKFSKKYQNMLSIKLFRLVFCLFWFNRNIETLCYGIEAKQPKQTISKQSKKNGKTLNFLKKYQNMLHIKLFRLVFWLFWFNRNIENLCFGKEAKQPKQTFCFG